MDLQRLSKCINNVSINEQEVLWRPSKSLLVPHLLRQLHEATRQGS